MNLKLKVKNLIDETNILDEGNELVIYLDDIIKAVLKGSYKLSIGKLITDIKCEIISLLIHDYPEIIINIIGRLPHEWVPRRMVVQVLNDLEKDNKVKNLYGDWCYILNLDANMRTRNINWDRDVELTKKERSVLLARGELYREQQIVLRDLVLSLGAPKLEEVEVYLLPRGNIYSADEYAFMCKVRFPVPTDEMKNILLKKWETGIPFITFKLDTPYKSSIRAKIMNHTHCFVGVEYRASNFNDIKTVIDDLADYIQNHNYIPNTPLVKDSLRYILKSSIKEFITSRELQSVPLLKKYLHQLL